MKWNAAILLVSGLFLLSTIPYDIRGCVNQIRRDSVSEPIDLGGTSPEQFLGYLVARESSLDWENTVNDLTPFKRGSSIEQRNNVAVALLHMGRTKEAIEILVAIERMRPGLYHTATNLGTAYELNGQNADALKWIKEGIKRNPASHNGSEWLHVKILEAKIAIERDPNWLAANSVLGISRQPNELVSHEISVVDHLGQPKGIVEIESALIYQLHERLKFVKPPEGVVANLLYDLGRILRITRSAEHGAIIGAFAERYGHDLMPWTFPTFVETAPPLSEYLLPIAGGLGVVLLVVGSVALTRRKQQLQIHL